MPMTNRENALALLRYESYEKVPLVHFGYWQETLAKWQQEGHITKEQAVYKWTGIPDGISTDLGFDFGWQPSFMVNAGLNPAFEWELLETMPDGTKKLRNHYGVIVLDKEDAGGIPAEVGHTLEDRESWESEFLPRLQFSEDRVDAQQVAQIKETGSLQTDPHLADAPLGLHCGSLMGILRDWMGIENLYYLYADDEDLYDEIIDTVGDLSYKATELALQQGITFDYAHFWEDLCYKNGPLVMPGVFEEKVGPHYKRITDLLTRYGIDIISLDSDGMIDTLLPTWIENGVNTMFPIEVGTWNASIAPWKEKYGKTIRGVGGMRKYVFAQEKSDIDKEIERLKPLVDMGGYIPCPDHLIPPDAKFENVLYYCEQFRKAFQK